MDAVMNGRSRRASTLRTRLVMAGAFIGALAVLSASMLFSWPVSVKTAASTAADEAAAAFDSPTGTCLNWPHDNPRNMRRVSCESPHTFEVASNVDIGRDFGPKTPPPEVEAWQQIVTERCTSVVAEYLGGKLDPAGKYTAGALKPTAEQWRGGDRKLRCGLQRVTPSGERLMPTTGAATDQDQSNIHEPGTCFALIEGQVGDPIDCASAHSYEVVGNIDLKQALGEAYLPEAEQQEKLIDICAQVANEFTGNKNLAEMGLSLYSDTLSPESWDAGSFRVNCKVGALEADGVTLKAIRGSVKAEPPETPPATQPPSTQPSG